MTGRAGTTRAPLAPAKQGGYTLLELILVVVLLALFASVTAPRLINSDARRADLEAEAVRALLSTVAHREATTTEPLALIFDASSSTLRAEVRRPRTLPSGAEETAWRPDPLIAPVTLERTELRDAHTDAIPLGRRSWRVEFPITDPRPPLRLVLAGRTSSGGIDRTWTVDLPAGATVADIITPGSASRPSSLPAAIDLDAAGRGDQPW